MEHTLATVGNWTNKIPLELTLHILNFLSHDSSNELINVLKTLRLVNRSFSMITTPLLFSEYSTHLKHHCLFLKGSFGQSFIPNFNETLNALDLIITKSSEKKNALLNLSKLPNTIPQAQIQQILIALCSLSSEFWALGEIAKKIKDNSKDKPQNQYYGFHNGEYWNPPDEPHPHYPDFRFGREPPDFARDRLPPGLPNIPSAIGPFGNPGLFPPSGYHPAPYRFGEPDPDHQRRPGGNGNPPMQPDYDDTTSPLGSGLPAPNPFDPTGRGRGSGFNPKFI
eukprot:TRINITY_DN168_c0_g1_i2.p1 TRINITY_DN168_c0_g1~~TRINITY_DN168_c0_g1_i2.p1  ORF type:complete len:281 (-),score=42.08 TRINITY_DN168_c0_g1_i2:58-900(-)